MTLLKEIGWLPQGSELRGVHLIIRIGVALLLIGALYLQFGGK